MSQQHCRRDTYGFRLLNKRHQKMFLKRRWLMIHFTRILAWALLASLVYIGTCNGAAINVSGLNDSVEYFKTEYDAQKRVLDLAQLEQEQLEKEELKEKGEPNHVMFVNSNEKPNETIAKPINFSGDKNVLLTNKENTEESFKENTFEGKPQTNFNGDIIQETLNLNGRNILPILSENNLGEVVNDSNTRSENEEVLNETNNSPVENNSQNSDNGKNMPEMREHDKTLLEEAATLGMGARNLSGEGLENSNEENESSQEQNNFNSVQTQLVHQNEGSREAITEKNLTDSQSETTKQVSPSDVPETREKDNLQLEDTVSLGMQQRNLSGDGSGNLSNEDKGSSQEQNTLNNVQPQPVAQNEGSGEAVAERNLTDIDDYQPENRKQVSPSDVLPETREKDNLQLEDTVPHGMQQRNLSGDGSGNLSNEDKESSQEQNTLNNVQPQPVAQTEGSGEVLTERNLTDIDVYQPETTKQVSPSNVLETREKETLNLEDTVPLRMQQRNLSGDGSENLLNEDKESSQEQNTLNNVQPQPVAQNEGSEETVTERNESMDPNTELDQEKINGKGNEPNDNENSKQPSEIVETSVNEENKNINANNNDNGIQDESETKVPPIPNKDQSEEYPEDKAPPSPSNCVLIPATNEDPNGPNSFGKLTFSENLYNNGKGTSTIPPQHDNTPKNVVNNVNFVANLERRINEQDETPTVYAASINSSNTQSSETAPTFNGLQETESSNLEKENVKNQNGRDITPDIKQDALETNRSSGLDQVETNDFENNPTESQIERPPKNNLEKDSDELTNDNVQNTTIAKEINPKLEALKIVKEAIQTMPSGDVAVQQGSILSKNEGSTNKEERSSFNSMSKSTEYNGESVQNIFSQLSKDTAQEEKRELIETQVNNESTNQEEAKNKTQILEVNMENENNSLEKKDVSKALYSVLDSLHVALSEIKAILPSYFKVGETNNESTSSVVQTLNNKEPISSARVSPLQNTLPPINDMLNNNNFLKSSDLKEKINEEKEETLLKINSNSEELYNKRPVNESEEYYEEHKLGDETSTGLTDKPTPQNFIKETEKSTIFNSVKNTSRQNESDDQEQIQRQRSETMELNKEGDYVLQTNEEQKDLDSEKEKTSTDTNDLLNRQANKEIDGRAKVVNNDNVQEKRNTENNLENQHHSELENMKDYLSSNKTVDTSKDYRKQEDLIIKEEKINGNKLTSDLDTSTSNKLINSNETSAEESSVSLDSEVEGKLPDTKEVKNDDYLKQRETENGPGEPEKSIILTKHRNDDTSENELAITESNRTINSENSTLAQNNLEENTVKEHKEDSVGGNEKSYLQSEEQPKNSEKHNRTIHQEPHQEDTQLLLEKIADEGISHKEDPQLGISESRTEDSKEVDGSENSDEDTKEGGI